MTASRQLLSISLLVLILFGSNADEYSLEWWEDSSLYQVYVRSFKDSDGDGIGDLNGVTSKLEHFKEIGIDAIWLTPVFKSPQVDMGYDVSDYKNIDPMFGTMSDFEKLVEKAKRLGIKVILDMVLNHASTENQLFKNSVNRVPGYEDMFVWQDGKPNPQNTSERLPPNNWKSVFGGSGWEWNEVRQQFYLHLFNVVQADFNWRNQQVYELWYDIFEFWLAKGADGLRLDAPNFLVEAQNEDGTLPDQVDLEKVKNRLENLPVLYALRRFVDNYQLKNGGDVIPLYSEAYGTIEFVRLSYTDGKNMGVHVPFNFDFVRTERDIPIPEDLNVKSNAMDVDYFVNRWMNLMWDDKQGNWQIGNHDNPRLPTRMGKQRIDIMNMLVAALPGISVTYYGEEVGMLDGDWTTDKREVSRSPMQWDISSSAGFSSNSTPWLPLSKNHEYLNMQRERGVARSTLNVYKAMHKLKKTAAFKAYKQPNAFECGAINANVYQVVRSLPGQVEYRILLNFGKTIEVLHGLTDKVMTYDVLNSYSPHSKGDKVDLSKRIVLMPNEGIVLRWTATP